MKKSEQIFWSIALPGFAQILNGHIVKGFFLVGLEFLINVMSNLNIAIVHSFQGNIQKAIVHTDFGWLMFYPCLYLFAMWDGVKDAGGFEKAFAFMPYVFSAYIGTIGVIYSPTLKLFGKVWGPVFLPILFLIIGALMGIALQRILIYFTINKKKP